MSKRHFTDSSGSPRSFFTISAVAKALGKHRNTISRYVQEGQIKDAYSVGKEIHIPADSMEEFLRARQISGRGAKRE